MLYIRSFDHGSYVKMHSSECICTAVLQALEQPQLLADGSQKILLPVRPVPVTDRDIRLTAKELQGTLIYPRQYHMFVELCYLLSVLKISTGPLVGLLL